MVNAWKDLLSDVSCINRGCKMGDSSKIKNDEKWYIPFAYIVATMLNAACSMLLSSETIFFLVLNYSKLQGKMSQSSG